MTFLLVGPRAGTSHSTREATAMHTRCCARPSSRQFNDTRGAHPTTSGTSPFDLGDRSIDVQLGNHLHTGSRHRSRPPSARQRCAICQRWNTKAERRCQCQTWTRRPSTCRCGRRSTLRRSSSAKTADVGWPGTCLRTQSRACDVFDRRGMRVDRVAFPGQARVVGFGPSSVSVAELDDDDLPHLSNIT
jgi:hypothetical protein